MCIRDRFYIIPTYDDNDFGYVNVEVNSEDNGDDNDDDVHDEEDHDHHNSANFEARSSRFSMIIDLENT